MAHFEQTLMVHAPVERVFAYTIDLSKLPEHDATVIECHAVTPGALHKNSRLRLTLREGDREREMEAEVTELTPNQAFAFHTVGSGAYLRRRYAFVPAGDDTEVRVEGELALPGLVGRLQEMLWARRTFTREAEAESQALKRNLET